MEHKTFDLSFITDSVNSTLSLPRPDYSDLYLRIASLFIEFTIEDIDSNLIKMADRSLNEQETAFLIDQSTLTTVKEINSYVLKDTVRELVYKNFGEINKITSLLNSIQFRQQSKKQELLNKLLLERKIAYQDFGINDLVSLYQLLAWVGHLSLEKPDPKNILDLIKSKERLSPFYSITKHFAGRAAELALLKNYVEWLPTDSIIQNIKTAITDRLNWKKRPPLMVTGLGGIGKSTLIGKFIIDHLDYQGKGPLPFVYLDFDRPGLSLSNVMLLVAESLSQLKVQFPTLGSIFDEIIGTLKTNYLSRDKIANNSRSIDQIDLLETINSRYDLDLKIPVLIVFDSFEEIQARASGAELRVFFSFLSQLNTYMPRIRYVFVGRAEVIFEDIEFEHLKLGSFDKESAIGFLSGHGLEDKEISTQIYDKFGGNPLTLNLVINLLQNENLANEKLDSVKVSSFFIKVDEARIQQELVRRNLDHIRDQKVRDIAIPGILVRLINPEIIREVLAGPCGLGKITLDQARAIFDALKLESFLIQQDGPDIYFRQDLRIALKDLIVKQNPEKATAIHTTAISYYGRFKDEESRAEYLYHRLMRGDSVEEIEPYLDLAMRPYLERSFIELSESARLSIAPLLNIYAHRSAVVKSDHSSWERVLTNEIRDAFKKGDDKDLLLITKELSKRRDRSADNWLFFYESKLYIRINEIERGRKCLYDYMKAQSKNDNPQGFHLLLSNAFEYEFDYYQSFKQLEEEKHLLDMRPNAPRDFNITINFVFSYLRMIGRTQQKPDFDILKQLREVLSYKENFSPPKTYQYYLSDSVAISQSEVQKKMEKLSGLFWNQSDFVQGVKLCKQQFTKSMDLNRFLAGRWGMEIKDITEPGDINILYQDVLMFIEIQCSFLEFKEVIKEY
ncbi:hypothetical protein [Pedobacter psychrodurus]|uniref:hypothetical protein n=1 Tax=Pedobacter psychrodurus TaxID=2530456 RepID=UPI00292D6B2B|nr:hypothetical protein [Pedobacter psychrodurus]